MSVLVTGGAGYIGAHMLLALQDAGEKAVALDDFSSGARWLAPEDIPLIEADVGDQENLAQIINDYGIEDVIHFAGSILVPESIRHPLDYYSNNTGNTLKLLRACVSAGVKRFIFSSTAAVYGKPERVPISEQAPVRSITPYGASMAMSERILEDVAAAHDLSFVTLRYFNVAGADPSCRAGEIGKPTHLIKAAAQIALGYRKEKLQIYGGDYQTPDGSAIRDYVHVSDLAQAHLEALERLRTGGGSITLNCGYGRGYSVYEVVEAFRRVTGEAMDYDVAPRRAGDPAQLIADNAAIRTVLDWRPRYDDIDFIVETAIAWERFLETRKEKV
ncbi:UDP-glucose 4-epimerase GalE [Hyphococcus flavus]|uniref:UDP-glucose 4-epimerase n=1 Tax=Hyphococcus flavus TaxID=1866326 RepID=A0AAE9Z9U6_9PROT|nr:UDP-glucose 4-epimerase GalE [Hyphococcus flavus]WDI30069.1 UDP-glucose 4-epimerase GalE [Hyphococcus flavus]